MNQRKKMLAQYWGCIQGGLFPNLAAHFGPLNNKQEKLIGILEVIRIEEQCHHYRGSREVGRPLHDRSAIARSFVAKAVYQIATTELLILHLKADRILRRICGFERAVDVPSAATFSRAFKEFAISDLPARVHEAFIKEQFRDHLFGRIARDASAVPAREKAAKKVKAIKVKKRRGRPKKEEMREPTDEKVLCKQLKMNKAALLLSIPTQCDTGTKVDSKGYKMSWKGFKLHLDVADAQMPLSALLSPASLHDSQAAIPLSILSQERATYLYELMDAAYDAKELKHHSLTNNHLPLIDHNKRRGVKMEFAPHEAQRYKTRTMVERVFARLKDEFGLLNIRVKKHAKVFCHTMFSVLALTGDQFLRFISDS